MRVSSYLLFDRNAPSREGQAFVQLFQDGFVIGLQERGDLQHQPLIFLMTRMFDMSSFTTYCARLATGPLASGKAMSTQS